MTASADELRRNTAEAAGAAVPDTTTLLARLQDVQLASVTRMETFLRALTDAHRRIAPPRG